MGLAVLLLCARLSFTIGPNIQLLFEAGPALLLQELGHLFGTIALALPLAVLLRMGPATVGATFSIDREGSFAMVSERYGPDSDQYRGVLSMYVFGTLFGAVLISLIASLATSFNIFDPLALAMGAGVGSGSMMAAAAASVVSAHPEMADQVLAVRPHPTSSPASSACMSACMSHSPLLIESTAHSPSARRRPANGKPTLPHERLRRASPCR